MSPCDAATPEERQEKIIRYREVLKKVKAILEDDEAVSKIMEKYDKQAETKEEHDSKRIKRIEELCKLAEVDYKTFLMALGTSKQVTVLCRGETWMKYTSIPTTLNG